MEGFEKYLKIKQLGDEENAGILDGPSIIVEEKLDGANFRFIIKDKKIIFGSRTQQITSDDGEDTNVAKGFTRCLNYVRDTINKLPAFPHQYEGYIFYGECMVKHSIDYNWDEIPPFLGFDIYNIKEKRFIDYTNKTSIFTELGFKTVPSLYNPSIVLTTKNLEECIPIARYAPISNLTMKAEGIVIKNYAKQLFAKYVREEFKEINRETFGGSKKYADNDDEKIVFTYCTNARIDKALFKLLDEGEKLQMELMHKLPNKVLEDIYEEHWKDLLLSSYKLDLRNIRGLVSKRCLAVLKQIITNEGLK